MNSDSKLDSKNENPNLNLVTFNTLNVLLVLEC